MNTKMSIEMNRCTDGQSCQGKEMSSGLIFGIVMNKHKCHEF